MFWCPTDQNGPLGPNFSGDPGIPWDQTNGPWFKFSPTCPAPIEGVQDHQDPGLPKAAGEALVDELSPKGVLNPHLRGFEVMSSKLTELTESSPSTPPPSVLCGSGVFSQLSSPSMPSSGHFDPSQTYDGFRAVEKPCCRTRLTSSNVRRHLWSRKDGPFGQEFPIPEEPTPDATTGFSQLTGSRQRDVARWKNVGGPIPISGRPIHYSPEVPISRTNTDGVVKVVKKIKRIADPPSDPDDEESDELDGEEVEVVPHSVDHPSSNSSAQPLANRFQGK
ncbi:hypothetical protein O181_047881 [Austropuccinia psidii MF-1]|uniref:Uncharacterized protein n=1 Tax=Austropuccinia psidii MF-1 TaxID=1389203 RepID=A0A9Q3HJW2_9BASI|nr:hypothetical protein [Austropuccinia psidii MF-1]